MIDHEYFLKFCNVLIYIYTYTYDTLHRSFAKVSHLDIYCPKDSAPSAVGAAAGAAGAASASAATAMTARDSYAPWAYHHQDGLSEHPPAAVFLLVLGNTASVASLLSFFALFAAMSTIRYDCTVLQYLQYSIILMSSNIV